MVAELFTINLTILSLPAVYHESVIIYKQAKIEHNKTCQDMTTYIDQTLSDQSLVAWIGPRRVHKVDGILQCILVEGIVVDIHVSLHSSIEIIHVNLVVFLAQIFVGV